MPVTYQNRAGKTYYLHARKTKTRRDYHYFSRKETPKKGAWLAEEIPESYEIYEHPGSGGVFLRVKIESELTPDEVETVKRSMENHCALKAHEYKIDVREDTITILMLDQDMGGIVATLRPDVASSDKLVADFADRFGTYGTMMRFCLVDREKRTFDVERRCFLVGIDDWITVAHVSQLEELVRRYVRHIGQDSFYELG